MSEMVVSGISLVPGAKVAGEALTGVKEVGEVLHQGQHALHAAASAMEVGAVHLEERARKGEIGRFSPCTAGARSDSSPATTPSKSNCATGVSCQSGSGYEIWN
jgi:hypothetical protein